MQSILWDDVICYFDGFSCLEKAYINNKTLQVVKRDKREREREPAWESITGEEVGTSRRDSQTTFCSVHSDSLCWLRCHLLFFHFILVEIFTNSFIYPFISFFSFSQTFLCSSVYNVRAFYWFLWVCVQHVVLVRLQFGFIHYKRLLRNKFSVCSGWEHLIICQMHCNWELRYTRKNIPQTLFNAATLHWKIL